MLGLGSSLITSSVINTGGVREMVASYNFNTDTGSSASSTTAPTGWAKADSGNFTLYGSTVDGPDLVGNQAVKGWIFDSATTASTNTGPGGGHIAGPDTVEAVQTSGDWNAHSGNRFLYYEASGASHATIQWRGAIRTDELDFSAYASIEMTFWFNAYGAAFGDDFGAGIAVTTSATSASSAAEAGSGLGFTSDTAGGAAITYTDLGGSAVSTPRIGHAGQVNTSGHGATLADANKWIKATVDLSAAAGQSSVYIHFGMFAHPVTSSHLQDICIDSISIIGTT